jgi:hypothetical protein
MKGLKKKFSEATGTGERDHESTPIVTSQVDFMLSLLRVYSRVVFSSICVVPMFTL